MEMYNPPHPGKILKEDYIKPLGLTITEVAKSLKVSRNALSEIVNEKTGISSSMALKIAKAFNSDAEFWIRLQNAYDLWQAKKNTNLDDIEVINKVA